MYTRDAMITDVHCCQEQDTLQYAASLMWQHDCGSIPVLDQDNRPIGMLTDRDIAMAAMLNNCSLSELSAKQVMGRQPVVTCRTNSSLERCLALMEEHEIRRIPVVDEEGRMAGIISMGDAVAFTSYGQEQGRRRRETGISSDKTLSMLRNVSAHHGPTSSTLQ